MKKNKLDSTLSISQIIHSEKKWLVKYLKGPVSEHPLADIVSLGRKHCLNLHGSTFVQFCHHSETN